MAKLTLATVTGDAAVTLNANFAAIVAAVENTLSRDGTTPNTMSASFDMNSNFILNLPTPTNNAHAATKKYVDDEVLNALENIVGPDGLAAIAALGKTDGGFIVGDGTTWVEETGATARASLGLTIGTDVQAYDAGLAYLAGLAITNEATFKSETNLEIGVDVQAYSAVLAATTASFTTADETKLDGIEASADVTDTANVTAAGALMDSEVDADIKTLAVPANTTISTFGASLVDDADASAARTTLGLGTAATSASTDFAAVAGDTFTGAVGFEDAINYLGASVFYVRSRLNGGQVQIGTETTGGTLYYPVSINGTADTLIFNNAAGEMARFTTQGRLGIGTTGPSVALEVSVAAQTNEAFRVSNTTDSARLHVLPGEIQAQNHALVLTDYDNQGIVFLQGSGGTETARIEATTGYLGVNNSNPDALIHVVNGEGTFSWGGETPNKPGVRVAPSSGRGGFMITATNDFLDGTSVNSGFSWLYPYAGTTGTSPEDYKVFRAARGTTLADMFYVTAEGRGFFNGDVSIGTSTADAKLHVHAGSSGLSAPASTTALYVEDNGDVAISIVCPSANSGYLLFGDNGNADVGRIQYNHGNNTMSFWANDGEKMSITNSAFYCQAMYDATTGSAANMHADNSGIIRRSTSAAKYKVNREDISQERIDKFFEISKEPDTLVWYRSNTDLTSDPEDYSYYGIIADRFEEEFPQLCDFGAEGEVEGFAYERTTAFLIAKVNELTERLEKLENA